MTSFTRSLREATSKSYVAGSGREPSAPSSPRPTTLATRSTSWGSYSRRAKSCCRTFFKSSCAGKLSLVLANSSLRAAITSGVMMSELLIWCTMRPENAQAFGSLGPASGCTASAKAVHRQYEASSAFSRDAKPLLAPSTAATAAPPSCSPSPPFAGASLSTARWLAPLRASKRRSCARSTTSRSAGAAMPAFAFFLAKPLPRLPIDSAIASKASSASATLPPVRASARLSRVASARPANTLWLA
mmetsp:Transcript_52367/g.150095  ORF Transcript_52367/g.150095 Transcript_52367/m.150095 type:complete len:245 (-) Transcript_52367:2386-3120(-)